MDEDSRVAVVVGIAMKISLLTSYVLALFCASVYAQEPTSVTEHEQLVADKFSYVVAQNAKLNTSFANSSSNSITIDQTGQLNSTSINQLGQSNTLYLFQGGFNNSIDIDQQGTENHIFASQQGAFNQADLSQLGSANQLQLFQSGFLNSVTYDVIGNGFNHKLSTSGFAETIVVRDYASN